MNDEFYSTLNFLESAFNASSNKLFNSFHNVRVGQDHEYSLIEICCHPFSIICDLHNLPLKFTNLTVSMVVEIIELSCLFQEVHRKWNIPSFSQNIP